MLRIDVAPIPGHAFYKQTEFEGLFSDDFFQLLGLAAQILDFGAGRRTRCVTGEAAFAGFEELFRPAVVQALGDAFVDAKHRCAMTRQSSAMVASPRSPSRTMRIFSSAEYCLRVALRISRTSRSDDVSGVLDFCLMVHSSGGDDEPKILRSSSR